MFLSFHVTGSQSVVPALLQHLISHPGLSERAHVHEGANHGTLPVELDAILDSIHNF